MTLRKRKLYPFRCEETQSQNEEQSNKLDHWQKGTVTFSITNITKYLTSARRKGNSPLLLPALFEYATYY